MSGIKPLIIDEADIKETGNVLYVKDNSGPDYITDDVFEPDSFKNIDENVSEGSLEDLNKDIIDEIVQTEEDDTEEN